MARYLDRDQGRLRAVAPPTAPTGRLLPRHLPRPRRRHRPLETVVDEVRAITGRIDLVHCQRQPGRVRLRADRHANVGAGTIDPDRAARGGRAAAGAPVVFETPGGAEEQRADFAFLRERRPGLSRRSPPAGRPRVPAMPLTVRPISARAPSRVRHRAVGPASCRRRPGPRSRPSGAESARLVRRRAAWSAPAWCCYRRIPGLRRSLAYLPEGPVLDWAPYDLEASLTPLLAHLKQQGAFSVKIGPQRGHPPLDGRPRSRTAIADGGSRGSATSTAERTAADGARVVRARLRRAGLAAGRRRGDGRVRRLSSRATSSRPARRTDPRRRTLLAGFNQLWRRNIRKAEKAGVVVSPGGYDDLQGVPRALRRHRRARRLHPAPAGLLPAMWTRMRRRGPGPDPAVPGPPRGRAAGGHHRRPRRARTSGTPTAPRPPTGARSAPATPSSGG